MTTISKSYKIENPLRMNGGTTGDGARGGVAKAKLPPLGPGGRGANGTLYLSTAGRMVLQLESGSGSGETMTGFSTTPPQMRGSLDTIPSTSTLWPRYGGWNSALMSL